MIDVPLMHVLLKAVPDQAVLILVGGPSVPARYSPTSSGRLPLSTPIEREVVPDSETSGLAKRS